MYSKQLLRLASNGLRSQSCQALIVAPKSFVRMGHQSLQMRFLSQEVKSERVQKISEEILALSTLEMNQLVLALQTKLGVSDAMLAGVGTQAAGAGKATEAAAAEPEPEKVKDVFGIKIGAVDAKAKIKIIKEVRTITGLGLKEAKELVEKAPVTIKDGLKQDEAEAFKKLLVEAGATVELI